MTKDDSLRCPACLGNNHSDAGKKNDFHLRRCDSCKTIFAGGPLEDSNTAMELKELYDHYYDSAQFELPPAAKRTLIEIVGSFEIYRQSGKLLDIGFGEGGLLSVAAEADWECYGTELSPNARKYGREKGWTISGDALNDPSFPRMGFDIVTMIELVEHVPNPDILLETAFEMLRPSGLLFLTTPNALSINQRLLGTDWSVVCPPEHITIWSPRGICDSLMRNKFVPKNIRTEGFNPVEVLAKLRPNKNRRQVHRNEAGFALNEAFTSKPWRRSVKNLVNKTLSAFQLGDGIKVWAEKQS